MSQRCSLMLQRCSHRFCHRCSHCLCYRDVHIAYVTEMFTSLMYRYLCYTACFPQASINGHPLSQTQPKGHLDANPNSLSHSTTSSLNSAPPTSSLNSAPPTSSLNSAGESSYSTSPNSAHSSGDDSGDDYITGSPPSPSEAESKLEYTSGRGRMKGGVVW